VHLHLSSRVPLVDHTTGESLRYFLEEFSGQDQSPTLVIEGWDHMRGLCPITRRARASPTHSSLSSHQVPAPCAQGDRHGAVRAGEPPAAGPLHSKRADGNGRGDLCVIS